MDALSAIEEIVRDLLIFVAVMTALLIALVVIVSRLPDDNPLKRVLTSALAIPIEPIPGLDAVYDIGAPILLLWYWFTFFKNHVMPERRAQKQIGPDHRS